MNQTIPLQVYRERFEVSVNSNGVEKNNFFYLIGGKEFVGVNSLEDLVWHMNHIATSKNCNVEVNYRGNLKHITMAIDGYFGRPLLITGIIKLRCLNNKEIKKLKEILKK